MKNITLLLVTIFSTVALVIGIAVYFPKQPEKVPLVVQRSLIEDGARLVEGPDDAKVTVVEFSDFQCPSCKSILPDLTALKTEYKGRIRFVYRHFPIESIHTNARLAAQASEVAAETGKFWQMHDLLFTEQERWAAEKDNAKLKELFAGYAEKIEIDKTTFLEKIDKTSAQELVDHDLKIGLGIPVPGTPTFFVNGTETAAPKLRSTIESLL